MFARCYDEKQLNKRPSYYEVTICKEWHNFQNFAKWYEDNYYAVKDEVISLDKDILFKGNKVYSPNTCIFVTRYINSLFTTRKNDRGEYPIGVTFNKNNGYYRARISKYGNKHDIGNFNNQLDAFNSYKTEKEKHIKEVAERHREVIPNRLYDAMYRYEVEITD